MENINIRNFVIISHIDHGKSTLADRFLELTKAIPKEKMHQQFLDSMDLEQERGITIKMHPVRMSYTLNDRIYTLNLIDTPGHVDFSYEVSRALACVEGAVLLVDATKGIQAQTVANLEQALKQNLVVIPAVNKIDLPQSRTKETKTELANLLNVSENQIFEISAKYGTNVENLLCAIVEKIPPPVVNEENFGNSFRALIFDSKYDYYKGTIAYVRIFDGEVKLGDKIYLLSNKTEGVVKEIGYFTPHFSPKTSLKVGEIGYIATGIKESGKVRVGDTVTKIFNPQVKPQYLNVKPLPGYKEPKPMVFASFYPENPNDFDLLKEGLEKLKLNDAALTFEQESKEGLGRGFRCGFLGTLHAEIIAERLRREFGLNLVITSPQVVYKIINKKGEEISVYSASDWPNDSEIKEIKEPWVVLEIITPNTYLGEILELLKNSGAKLCERKYFGPEKTLLIYQAPLRTIISGFYSNLKSKSSGFASMNYEFLEYRTANLVKLDILIAGKKEEAFSKIVPLQEAFSEGRKIVKKLKEVLPSQLFSVPLQAALGGKIIARETLRARGKDVIAPLYGGDYTRKRKLLEKQKKGKKELKEKGRVRIGAKVFLEIFKSS
jgi:GTP-binding protein LepA